jgi:hypothetical protein
LHKAVAADQRRTLVVVTQRVVFKSWPVTEIREQSDGEENKVKKSSEREKTAIKEKNDTKLKEVTAREKRKRATRNRG